MVLCTSCFEHVSRKGANRCLVEQTVDHPADASTDVSLITAKLSEMQDAPTLRTAGS